VVVEQVSLHTEAGRRPSWERELLGRAGIADHEELQRRVATLTEAEREVLQAWWRLRSTKAVTALRRCAPGTIDRHLANVRRKLSCGSTVEAGLLLLLADGADCPYMSARAGANDRGASRPG